MKKPLHMLTGLNLVDYGFDPDTFLPLVKRFKHGKENGNVFNVISVRLDQKRPTTEQLYEWAKYFHDNEIYFKTSGNFPRFEKEVTFTLSKEETEKIAELAGEYYLGDGIGEFGGFYATRAKGYDNKTSEDPVQGIKDCKEAKETYIRQIRKKMDKMRENGAPYITSTQAVTLTPYDYEAGVDTVIVEVAPRNQEQIVAFGRGAQRAYKREVIGAWLAHEFYGGYHQFDPLKDKRFTAEYYNLYLAGYDFVCLESGFREIHSHVDSVIPEGGERPTSYLNEATKFADFCKSDIRPGKNGPITKVAFVQGNLDGFGWGNSSSVWGQYHDEKWGFGAPEYSYRVLDDVYTSCGWHEGRNFGDYDYSTSPAYGQYDVIPATCPLDVMKQYKWLIFCGWNTMTPEIVETLKAYVKGGGNLLITAAHMRDSIDREKKGKFAEGLEELVGCKLSEETFRCNDGYKFVKFSTVDGVMYPGTKTLLCDPAWSAGYTNYVKIEPTTAVPVCFISDTFATNMYSSKSSKVKAYESFGNTYVDGSIIPLITENKLGDGNVIFMANSEYPGDPAIFPLYRLMVKAALSASHRTSDIKVVGSDKLRFAVYDGGDFYKVYIFNSDFNFEQRARVIYNGKIIADKTVNSVELEIVEFKK